jgi:hypothetical protein
MITPIPSGDVTNMTKAWRNNHHDVWERVHRTGRRETPRDDAVDFQGQEGGKSAELSRRKVARRQID